MRQCSPIVCDHAVKDQLFSFEGRLNEDSLLAILEQVELTLKDIPLKYRKKAFNVALESLQNVYHHGKIISVNEEEGRWMSFYLLQDKERVSVLIGNYINNESKEIVIKKILRLNQFSLVDLRKEYLEQLVKDVELSSNFSAGLGLYEIAKKSNNNIDHKVTMLDQDTYFICVNIKVN